MNYRLQDIPDVNCWLGHLQWTSLGMANIAYNEFRIYDHAFDPAEVSASLAAGPDTTFGPPVLQADSATLHPEQKVRVPVLANDSPGIAPGSITIIDPPQSGSASRMVQGISSTIIPSAPRPATASPTRPAAPAEPPMSRSWP